MIGGENLHTYANHDSRPSPAWSRESVKSSLTTLAVPISTAVTMLRLVPAVACECEGGHLVLTVPHGTVESESGDGRGDVQGRVAEKEVVGSEEHAHRFGGHDGEILRSWEVRESKVEPDDNVPVLDRGVLREPLGQSVVALGGDPVCLGHVVSRRVELVVDVRRDVDRVACEPGPVPDETALLRQERGGLATHDLVCHRFLGVRVQHGGVDNVPRPTRLVAVVGRGLGSRLVDSLFRVEAVSVVILLGTDFFLCSDGVRLDDGVVLSIDGWVDPDVEDVLVVVGDDSVCDLCAPLAGLLVR